MEELKIIMEALSKLGPAASTAFMYWCIKEVLIYTMCPITFVILGRIVLKIIAVYMGEEKDYTGGEEEGD